MTERFGLSIVPEAETNDPFASARVYEMTSESSMMVAVLIQVLRERCTSYGKTSLDLKEVIFDARNNAIRN